MKVICILIIVATLPIPLMAQEQKTDTSSKIADSFGSEARSAYLLWQKARREADMAYLAALRSALDKVTRQGKLKEATAIQGEIKRLETALGESEKVPLSKFLIGTSWENPTNGVVITLGEEGKGSRAARNNSQSYFSYKIDSEKQITIRWAAGPTSQFVLAEDRQSFVGGDVTWKRKK